MSPPGHQQLSLPVLLVLVTLSCQNASAFTATVSRTTAPLIRSSPLVPEHTTVYHHQQQQQQRLPIRNRRVQSFRKTRLLNTNGDYVNGSTPDTSGSSSSSSSNGSSSNESPSPVPSTKTRQHFFTKLPRAAIRIYSDYASRLWRETSSDARQRVASDRVMQSIRQVQHVFRGEEYGDYSKVSSIDRQNLLDACDSILADNNIEKNVKTPATVANGDGDADDAGSSTAVETVSVGSPDASKKNKKKKGGRSVLFGATMGAAVAGWVFSGNYVFTGLFTLMTILGQLEYYRMVMNTGVYPARRISIVGAASMFLTVRCHFLGFSSCS